MVYRKVAAARTETELEATLEEMRDRYGAAARVGAEPGRVRPHPDHGRPPRRRNHRPGRPAGRHKVQAAGEGRPGAAGQGGSRVARRDAGPAGVAEARPGGAAQGTAARPSARGRQNTTAGGQTGPVPEAVRPAAGGRPPVIGAATSWWTARATAGEVTAGFTKERILRSSRRPTRGPKAGCSRGWRACCGALS